MGLFSRRSNNSSSSAAAGSSTPKRARAGTATSPADVSNSSSSAFTASPLHSHSNSYNNSIVPPPPAKPSLKKKLSDTNLVASILSLKNKKSISNMKNETGPTNSGSNSSSARSSYNNHHTPADGNINGITVISVSDIVKPKMSQGSEEDFQQHDVPVLKKKSSFLKNPFNSNATSLSRTPSSSSLKKNISISNMIHLHKSSSKSNFHQSSNKGSANNKLSEKYLQNQMLDISAPASNVMENTPDSTCEIEQQQRNKEDTDDDDFGNENATPYVPANDDSFTVQNTSVLTKNNDNNQHVENATPITGTSKKFLTEHNVTDDTKLKDFSVNSENAIFLSPQVISPSRTVIETSESSINPDRSVTSSSSHSNQKNMYNSGSHNTNTEMTPQSFVGSVSIPESNDSNNQLRKISLDIDINHNANNENRALVGGPQIVSPTDYILQSSSPIEATSASAHAKDNTVTIRERNQQTKDSPDSGNRFSVATVDSFYFRTAGSTPVQLEQQDTPRGDANYANVVKSPLSNSIAIGAEIKDNVHEPVTMIQSNGSSNKESNNNNDNNNNTGLHINLAKNDRNGVSNNTGQGQLLPPIDNSIVTITSNEKDPIDDDEDEFESTSATPKMKNSIPGNELLSQSAATIPKVASTPKNSIIESFNNASGNSKSLSRTANTKSPPSSAKRYSKLVSNLLISGSSNSTTSPSSQQQSSSSSIKKVVPAFISSHFKSSSNNNNTPEKHENTSANSSNARYSYSGPLSASSRTNGSAESTFHLLHYSGSQKKGGNVTNNSTNSARNMSGGNNENGKTLSPIPLVTSPERQGLADPEFDGTQIYSLSQNGTSETKPGNGNSITASRYSEVEEIEHGEEVIGNKESSDIYDDDDDTIVNQRKHTSKIAKRISSLYYSSSSSKKNKKQLTIINTSSPPLLDSLHRRLSRRYRSGDNSDTDDSSDESSDSNDEESVSDSLVAAAQGEEIPEIIEATSIITAKRVTQSPKEINFNSKNTNNDKRIKANRLSSGGNPQIPLPNIGNMTTSSSDINTGSLSGNVSTAKKRLIAERVKVDEPPAVMRIDTDMANNTNNNVNNNNFINGPAPHTLLSPIVEVDTPQNKYSPSSFSLPSSNPINHNIDSSIMDSNTNDAILEPPSSEFLTGRIVNTCVNNTNIENCDANAIVSTPVNETIFISPTESSYSNFLVTPVSERARSYSSDYEEPLSGADIHATTATTIGNPGNSLLNVNSGSGHERSTSKTNIMNRLLNNNDSGEVISSSLNNNNEISTPYTSYKDDFTSPTHMRSSSMASSMSARSRAHTRANSGNFKTPKMVSSNIDFNTEDDIIDQTPIIHDSFKNSSQITLNHENINSIVTASAVNITKSPMKNETREFAAGSNLLQAGKSLKIQIFKNTIAEKSPDIPNTFTVNGPSNSEMLMSDIKSPISPSVLTYEALANNNKSSTRLYDGTLHSANSSADDTNSMASSSPTSLKFETPRSGSTSNGIYYEHQNNNSVMNHHPHHQSSNKLPIACTPIEMSKDPIFAKILKHGNNNNQSMNESSKHDDNEEAIIIESPNKTFLEYDRIAEDYDATITGANSNTSTVKKLRQQSTSSSISSFSSANPFLEKKKSPSNNKLKRQNSQTLRALNGMGSSPEKSYSNTSNNSPSHDSTLSATKLSTSSSSSPILRNSIIDGKRNTGSGLHHHHIKQLSNSTSDSIYDSIYRSSSVKSISQQSLIKKSPSITSLDFGNRHRSRRFSLGIHEESVANPDEIKDTDLANEYISMFVKASHAFDSTTLKNTDDSSICLSFKKGDNAFVYNLDSSGWAEVVLFNKEFSKGWAPMNFFKKAVDESAPFTNNIEDVAASRRYLKPLLVASAEFLLIDSQEIDENNYKHSSGDVITFGTYQEYINNIRDGVKLLLQYTNTISRNKPVVRKRPTLRKVRKSLLAEWYQLFSYVDHHSKNKLTGPLLESLQKMNLKIISRANIFLDVWAKESTIYENEMALSKKDMISKRRQNRKIHQETVFYLPEHPNAIDRFSQVKSLLYRYLLLILGRIDIVESNFYACEQLESVTHQIILLLRELLFVSKSATRLLHNDVSLYTDNSYDDILSSLSDLVSSVKRMVTRTEHDEQKLLLNEEDSDIQIEDDIDIKEFQYSKEGSKILRVAADTLGQISKVVKSCEKLLNTTGNFQLTASRKYPDFEKMNISNNEFIKCGLNQLLQNQIVLYKVTKNNSNWESHLPVGGSCKYAYIRGNSRSLTYSGSKLVQIFLKGDDLDYDIPLTNEEYDSDYCMNNTLSEIAYDDGSSNLSQHGSSLNISGAGKYGSKHSSMISLNNVNKKTVLGGSFKALVYLLTNERNFPSDFFITTFLLSFRNFSNSKRLVYELIKRFDVGDRERQFLIQNNSLVYPDYNNFDSLMRKRRRNVLTVIQIWLESYFERDSDFVAVPILINFINDAVIEYLPQEAYKLCGICCKLIMRHSRRNQEFIDIQLTPKRIGLVKNNSENHSVNATSSSLNLLSPSNSENDLMSLHSTASSSISISLSLTSSISNYSITSFRTKNQELVLERLIAEYKSILQTEWFIGHSPLSLTKMIDSWFEICSKDLNLKTPKFYNELLQHNTVEIAKQLTDIESKIFLAIQPSELLDENFREKRIHLQKSRTIEKSVLFTNLLSDLVSDSIVSPGFIMKTRVNNLKQWIKIGLACYQLRNYNSLAAIITVLQSAAISRLDKLWANLSAKYAETFDYLCKIINPYKNYKVYRSFLKPYFQNHEDKKSQLPLVPYINLFLQDIIFATDGNPNKRKLVVNGEEKLLINFDKYTKIVDCIARLQYLQIDYKYSSDVLNTESLTNSKTSIFSLSKNAEGEYMENENEMNDVLIVNKQLEEFILLMLWGTRQKNLNDNDRFWKHSLEIQPGK